MSELYPQLAHLHQLRHTMAKLRLNSIVLGADGRNRCMLGQFVCSTGRNAHQAGRSIFGPSRWLRGLIKPPRGRVLAYLDWKSQEFVIAAALSGDQHMLDAIASGDPYLWFAKMSKLAPEWATAETHPQVREVCKRCCLGVLYGMGARALALRTKKSELEARDLLDKHRRIFPTFWAWSCRAVHEATLFGHIDLAFGWRIHDGEGLRFDEDDTHAADAHERADAGQRCRDDAPGRHLRAPGRRHHQRAAPRRLHDRGPRGRRAPTPSRP